MVKDIRFSSADNEANIRSQIRTYQPQLNEQQISAYLTSLSNTRADLFVKSAMQSFAFLAGGLLLLLLLTRGYLKKNVALILIIALTIFDLSLVNKNHLKKEDLVKETVFLNEFPEQPVDTFLLEDEDLFRIYPFSDYRNTRWAYHHQSIGGYHGAVLKRYREMEEKCLYFPLTAKVPINWNIVNMLNVKYIIYNENVIIPNFERVRDVPDTRNFVYKNENFFPRAWFVKKQEVLTDKNRIFLTLNDPDFKPKDTVILESEVPPFSYDDSFTIEMLDRNIHYAKWETNNYSDGFMVISEIYYPAGWNVYINGEKTSIYPANYILRGVWVPAGNNTVEMKFEPKSYKISLILSFIGISLSILLAIAGIITYYRANYGKGIVYKME
jgi:hypothetical protein